MIYNETIEDARQKNVIDYVKAMGFKKVLDIGGAMYPWAREVVTHYFDLINPHEYLETSDLYDEHLERSIYIKGDINDHYSWDDVFKEAYLNGKFDFVTCTQTLEDIRNPSLVLQNMPLIAKEGFISVPHKYRELTLIEGYGEVEQDVWGLNRAYIGYMHHRWIFSVVEKENSKFLRLFPKLEFIHCIKKIQEKLSGVFVGNELSFMWKDNIPFEIINDDYLGPSPLEVFALYTEKLFEGI